MTQQDLARRQVARGALWSVPIVALASAAPALAASVPPHAPTTNFSTRITWGVSLGDESSDGSSAYKIFSTIQTDLHSEMTSPQPGLCIDDTYPGDTIKDVTLTFYLPDSGVTFTQMSDGSSSWSALSLDSGTPSRSVDGITYYPYVTRYVPTITAVKGSTCLPTFAFEGDSRPLQDSHLFVYTHAVINGGVSGSQGYLSLDKSA